jgi:hypothetical protein
MRLLINHTLAAKYILDKIVIIYLNGDFGK